jgi:hypothetical protein
MYRLPFLFPSIKSSYPFIMAILKFGAIVTEGSGSLGGHTIQNSQGGSQLRTKPIPRGNPSAAQLSIRSINQQLQAGWKALTPPQQKIWNDWPVVHGIMNAKGDKHALSGHSLWMKINFYYYQISKNFTLDPALPGPPYYGPNLIPSASSDFFTDGTGWYINIYGNTVVWNPAHFMELINANPATKIGNNTPVIMTNGKSYRVSFKYKSPDPPFEIYGYFGPFHIVMTASFWQTYIQTGVNTYNRLNIESLFPQTGTLHLTDVIVQEIF